MSTSPPRVALVSGGNRGIGRAIAERLAAEGLRVIVGARRAEEGATSAEQLGCGWIALDVADEHSRSAAIAEVLRREGRLDVLVNNAGVALDKWVPAGQLAVDTLRATLETNLHGPLRLCQLALPAMKAQNYGRIVNVSSELGSLEKCVMGGSAAYRISKTALNMLTRLLAAELKGPADILVNAAAPGWVKTELGGMDAPRTPAQGADTAVWLATLPAGGPSGGFFRDREPYPW